MAVLVETGNIIQAGPVADQLSAELAALAARVQGSVVVVRGARHGAGAGVVWNGEGLVVTNAHVVPGSRAEIELGRGKVFPAEVVARSNDLDIAALKLTVPFPTEGWVPAEIGDSAALRPGELVVAVGHPLGERNAVTLGMVGGAGKITWHGVAFDAIRLAITLRPGNSGGALADIAGRIVGIPNMVVGPGLALAVPSHVVRRFLRGEARD
jgi:serine protease Do